MRARSICWWRVLSTQGENKWAKRRGFAPTESLLPVTLILPTPDIKPFSAAEENTPGPSWGTLTPHYHSSPAQEPPAGRRVGKLGRSPRLKRSDTNGKVQQRTVLRRRGGATRTFNQRRGSFSSGESHSEDLGRRRGKTMIITAVVLG